MCYHNKYALLTHLLTLPYPPLHSLILGFLIFFFFFFSPIPQFLKISSRITQVPNNRKSVALGAANVILLFKYGLGNAKGSVQTNNINIQV